MQIKTDPPEHRCKTRRAVRSLLCIVVAFFLLVGLAGCGSEKKSLLPAIGDIVEENSTGLDGRKDLNRDDELLSDDKTAQDTEEGISEQRTDDTLPPPAPGETTAWNLISKAMEIMGDTSPVIVQTGEETINDEHCYLFATGENSLDGGKFTALNHYAISDSGKLYYMDILGGGTWIYIESGSPEDAAWWGEYQAGSGKLYVHNYSGKSFRFLFISNNGEEFEGVAAVYQHNFYQAEYMDLKFSIDKKADLITVIQYEEREDSAERSQFTGSYTRVEDE